MKTNTLKLILTLLTAGSLTLLAATRIDASNLSTISISVSYIAVAILIALAVHDYRAGSRSYVGR